MALTQRQARLASLTLDDVFTPDDNAATVAQLAGFEVRVSGEYDDDTWYHIDALSPSRALLASEVRYDSGQEWDN